jgi:hypothetical protein
MPDTIEEMAKLKSSNGRRGVPHTVYFSPELAQALADCAHRRRVQKSTIMRFAVEELLKKLESGQLELPLGL